jgi:serine/threonine-protein kinase
MEPERRYRSVDALIRDVNAYLEGRVLEARPASLTYTVGKFARRNRVALASAAVVLVVLTGAGIYFTVRLAHARDAAVAEAARTKRIQDFMFDMIGNGDAEAGPGSDLKVATLLDREAQNAERLGADAETQIDLYGTLGSMYNRLGKFDRSEKMLSLALNKAKQTNGPESAKVASLLVQMGTLHGDTDDLKTAQQEVEQAIEISSRGRAGTQDATLMGAKIALGRIYLQGGSAQKAIDTLTPIVNLDPKQAGVDQNDIRDATSAFAIAQLYAHHYDLAESYGRRAIELDRQLLGETHPQTGIDIANLASVKSVQGDLPGAEQLYREGREILLAWYGPDHPDVATASTILARILILQGKDAEAESLVRAALPIQEKVYGPTHERVSYSLNILGEIAEHRHQYVEAEADFSRALAIDQSIFGANDYKTAAMRGNLGVVYEKEGKYALAEDALHQSVDVMAALPPGNNLIGTARGRWGSSLLALKRYREAKAQLTLADQLLKAQQNPPAAELAIVHSDLATVAKYVH